MRGEGARLRVNREPFGDTQGLELVERQDPAFRPGSRRVDISLSLCLNTGNKEGKAKKGFRKLTGEAKGFSTRTTTKEGKR